MRQPPPSTLQWLIDSELNGHTVAETIKYWSDCEDRRDRFGAPRALPAEAILVDVEPRWVMRLRHLFGR
jgi:hypothetical protein